MELEGKIFKVLPLQSGTSQATGNAWMSQEYIGILLVSQNQTQPSYICLRVFGEDRIKRFNLQPNDEVKIDFTLMRGSMKADGTTNCVSTA